MKHSKRVRPIRNPLPARVPPGAVYIGRAGWGLPGSPYANPHPIGKPCKECGGVVHDRAGALEKYRQHLRDRPDLVAGIRRDFAGGRDAACWCADGLPCHGDIILAIARGGAVIAGK
jgi:uncharacterized protein DUF4326